MAPATFSDISVLTDSASSFGEPCEEMTIGQKPSSRQRSSMRLTISA